MVEIISTISAWILPSIIAFILLYGYIRKVPVYEAFIDGAKEGFPTAVSIIPPLVGMLVAISIFKDSGALDMFVGIIKPILVFLHIPTDIVPLAFLRPITGTGALAFTETLIKTHGPDSFIGKLAAVMQGSTDTTLYILTVYFGSVGIRKAKYALKVGLLADLAGIIASIYICVVIFG